MNEQEKDKIIDKIRQGLDSLDREITVETPDLTRFRQMVSEVTEKKQQKERKEFLLFTAFAALLLGFEFFAFSRSPLFFVAMQSIAFVSCMGGLFYWVRKEHKKVKST